MRLKLCLLIVGMLVSEVMAQDLVKPGRFDVVKWGGGGSSSSGLDFVETYENGSWAPWSTTAFCCGYSGTVVTTPTRAGSYAGRFELRVSDPLIWQGKRAQVSTPIGDPRIGNIGGGDEWYGFSLYLPSDYAYDATYEVVVEWYAPSDPGEAFRSPPLHLLTNQGKWELWTAYSSTPIQTGNDGTFVKLWEAPYVTEQWVDWVVRARWAYDATGQLQVWKDGQEIVVYNGPNCYNDQTNIHLLWGVYKPWWNGGVSYDVTQRVLYHDELRVAGSGGSYAEVVPRDDPPATPPIPVPVGSDAQCLGAWVLVPSDETLRHCGELGLTGTPTAVAPGGNLTVSWSVAEAGGSDWVALHPTGNGSYVWWQWTGGALSGSHALTAPMASGTYVFRYHGTSELTSNVITVQ